MCVCMYVTTTPQAYLPILVTVRYLSVPCLALLYLMKHRAVLSDRIRVIDSSCCLINREGSIMKVQARLDVGCCSTWICSGFVF